MLFTTVGHADEDGIRFQFFVFRNNEIVTQIFNLTEVQRTGFKVDVI